MKTMLFYRGARSPPFKSVYSDKKGGANEMLTIPSCFKKSTRNSDIVVTTKPSIIRNDINTRISTDLLEYSQNTTRLLERVGRKIQRRNESEKPMINNHKFSDFMTEFEDSKTEIRENPKRFVSNLNVLMNALA